MSYLSHGILQRTEYQRERSAQLVGDVCKEVQTLLIEFLPLLVLSLLQLQRVLQCQAALV